MRVSDLWVLFVFFSAFNGIRAERVTIKVLENCKLMKPFAKKKVNAIRSSISSRSRLYRTSWLRKPHEDIHESSPRVDILEIEESPEMSYTLQPQQMLTIVPSPSESPSNLPSSVSSYAPSRIPTDPQLSLSPSFNFTEDHLPTLHPSFTSNVSSSTPSSFHASPSEFQLVPLPSQEPSALFNVSNETILLQTPTLAPTLIIERTSIPIFESSNNASQFSTSPMLTSTPSSYTSDTSEQFPVGVNSTSQSPSLMPTRYSSLTSTPPTLSSSYFNTSDEFVNYTSGPSTTSAIPSTYVSDSTSIFPSSTHSEASRKPSSSHPVSPSSNLSPLSFSTPSYLPSQISSIKPSSLPTMVPSRSSSNSPTTLSSLGPSFVSTAIPSRTPSLSPTRDSSTKPSILISNIPSRILSHSPTRTSSLHPSILFRSQPTSFPTLESSPSPSSLISALPTIPMTSSMAPSQKCNITIEEREEVILNILRQVSDPTELSESNTPQFNAAKWLIHEDTDFFVCPGDKKLIQRYIMAVFYFATGGDLWSQCNAAINSFCPQGDRFLTGVSECRWGGTSCDEQGRMTNITFGKKILSH